MSTQKFPAQMLRPYRPHHHHYQNKDIMATRLWIIITILLLAYLLSACDGPNPQPAGLTPIPTLAPGATPTLVPVIQSTATAIPTPTTAPPPTTAAVPSTSTTPTAPTTTAPPAAADGALGAAIFQQNCTACHGVNGQGGTNALSEDVPPLRNNKLVQGGNPKLFQTIANGRAGTTMPAWLQENGGPLSEQEIGHVAAYLQVFQNVPALPTSAPAPTATPAPKSPVVKPSEPGAAGPAATLAGDTGRGRALFGKYCASCHGPQGAQGLANPGANGAFVPVLNPINPTIAHADAKIFAANVAVFIEHGSVPTGKNPQLRMPAFGDGKLLTVQQMADVIAYLWSLNKP
jgi:mono/diheme cytochrome c family protein